MPAPQEIQQQNQGQQQPLMPPGWEAVYSNEAKRYYFVDHVNKKTQWEDPRLTHSFIWGHEENTKLRHLSDSFAGQVPENVIRDALLRNGFKVDAAISELEAWNKRKSLSPRDSDKRNENRNSKRLSPAAGPKPKPETSTEPAGIDDFAYLFVKSKFSEVPDAVIHDILTNFNNDKEKAVKELKAMGFAGGKRQTATSRVEHREMNKEEKAKLKLARFQEAVNQLCSEFPTLTEEEIRKSLTDADCDFTESRSLLRQVEAKKKMESLLFSTESREAPTTSSTYAADGPSEAYEIDPNENQKAITFVEKPVIEDVSNIHEATTLPVIGQQSVCKGKIDLQLISNAKGPDSSLRCGPNKDILSKKSKVASGHNKSFAVGPSCSNRKGPDASLLQHAAFKLCQSR